MVMISSRHVTSRPRHVSVAFWILRRPAMASRARSRPMNFKEMPQADVPQGRHGKHKEIVTKILSDLDQVQKGVALKVPLAQLAEGKENVRSALTPFCT